MMVIAYNAELGTRGYVHYKHPNAAYIWIRRPGDKINL